MKKSTLVLLKVLVWIACLYPFAMLVYGAAINNLGPDATRTITFSTGLAALRLLVISLAITPLRRLFPGLSWLIKFRRLLGLFAYFYASVHLLAYVALYNYYDTKAIMQDIVRRRFITAGVAAWLSLVPLVLTSTTGMIRKLGGKRWNQLHKLVYVSVCLGILHYWWQVKNGVRTPLNITLIMAALFIARPVIDWWKKRSRARVAQANQTPAPERI
jgi:sulfoxide reductase heme-binding subunit YedZ